MFVGCNLDDLLKPLLQVVGEFVAELGKIGSIQHHLAIAVSDPLNVTVKLVGASINVLWIAIMNGLEHRSQAISLLCLWCALHLRSPLMQSVRLVGYS